MNVAPRSSEVLVHPPPVPVVVSRAAERLVIVANRLPVTASQEEGKLCLRRSSGGLVSGLDAYLDSLKRGNREHSWIGWPGIDPPDDLKPALIARLAEESRIRFSSRRRDEQVLRRLLQQDGVAALPLLSDLCPSDEHCDLLSSTNGTARPSRAAGRVVWIHDYHPALPCPAGAPGSGDRVLPPHSISFEVPPAPSRGGRYLRAAGPT
jgi:hypothetical protein